MLAAIKGHLSIGKNLEWNASSSKAALWSLVRSTLAEYVDVERNAAWIHQPEIMQSISRTCPNLAKEMLFFALRPKFRGDQADQWLVYGDIMIVMDQYSLILPELHFEGVFSANYFALQAAAAHTKKKQLQAPNAAFFSRRKNRGRCWAAVMNTADLTPTDNSGEHWVALFQQGADGPLEYFDAQAQRIRTRCMETLFWLAQGAHGFSQNKLRHQHDDHMCGVYACYYIYQRASGVSAAKIDAHIVNYDAIAAFRRVIFAE